MLAGVSEERREAMWTSAQQEAVSCGHFIMSYTGMVVGERLLYSDLFLQATGPQPGLKLLLEGEAAASPSQLSLHKIPLPPVGHGSAKSRRSAHHSSRHAPSSGKSLDDMVRCLIWDVLSYLSCLIWDVLSHLGHPILFGTSSIK